MTHIVETVWTEMTKGNFSFLILVVGVIQIFLMLRVGGKENEIKREVEKIETAAFGKKQKGAKS